MEIVFERTLKDYQEAVASQRVQSLRLKVAVTMGFLLFCILGTILLVSLGLTMTQGSMAMIFGSYVVGKGFSLAYSLWLKRDFMRHPNFTCQVRMQIDEAGLKSDSELWTSGTKWGAYLKRAETKNLFLLYLGARSVEIIPKRAFSAGQIDEFRRLIHTHLPCAIPISEKRGACVENPS